MTFDQTKIFSSEIILGNLLKLTSKYTLSRDEIALIDTHLKHDVLGYMSKKYPMTEVADVNKAL